jgi:transposase
VKLSAPKRHAALYVFAYHPRAKGTADGGHRIAFHFTPKHASWINQVEIWFSILVRRLLRRGNFTSNEHLKQRIESFIANFNETMAKPFGWTMTGKPLTI